MRTGSLFGRGYRSRFSAGSGSWSLRPAPGRNVSRRSRAGGSRCSIKTAGIAWLNRPASPQPVEKTGSSYDRLLADPALETGVWVEGPARFRLSLQGSHLVEVFVWVADQGRSSFELEN